jgi:hypothetical protein
VNIVDALRDRNLFGQLPAFQGLTSWSRWLVFLKAVYGLEMDQEELTAFRQFTGRTVPRPGGYPEAVAITGRQSGKSTIAAVTCALVAATSQDRGAFAILTAQDQRGAIRTLFNYAREPFRSVPVFARELVRETGDTLELAGGVSLACYPCRPAAVRGLRAVIACTDEVAFFRSTENFPNDKETLRAIRPCLAMTGGKLLILTSPYGQSGAAWDLHRAHYGRDESSTLIWQASAPEMNPMLPKDYLVRMEQDDPDAYRAEVLGEFRAGLSALFDPEVLDRCVVAGRREVPPVDGIEYSAFADPSGGRVDPFTQAIGHRGSEPRIVVDCLRAWRPPFNPSGVVEEAAALLKSYRATSVTGDRYGGEWPREAFRAHGVNYNVAEIPKSDLYLGLLPVVNSGNVELLDIPELLRELRGLERRRGASGRDRVDHGPGSHSHDDRANAIAGLVHLLVEEPGGPSAQELKCLEERIAALKLAVEQRPSTQNLQALATAKEAFAAKRRDYVGSRLGLFI